jgi:prephenate dehydratase
MELADEIRKVEYYSVMVPHKPGEAAKMLNALKDGGVNFTGLWGYPAGKRQAQFDLVPEDAGVFKKAAKTAGLEVGSKQTGFYVNGEDRPGAVAEALAKLGATGINVRAVQAVCGGGGRYGAFIEVEPEDAAKANRALSK